MKNRKITEIKNRKIPGIKPEKFWGTKRGKAGIFSGITSGRRGRPRPKVPAGRFAGVRQASCRLAVARLALPPAMDEGPVRNVAGCP